MEIDRFTRKMEAVILFVVMAFIIVLCFFRINFLEKKIVDVQNDKTVRIEYGDEGTEIKLPEGYHFELQGKDLILTED